jgi:hypothetical protein
MKRLIRYIKCLFRKKHTEKELPDWKKPKKIPVDYLSEEDQKWWHEEQEELMKSWYGE